MKSIKNENLGKEATDKVTGFKGIVGGHCEYITGCDQYLVTPPAGEDGKYPTGTWLDSKRLIISKEVKVILDGEEPDGPGIAAPIK